MTCSFFLFSSGSVLQPTPRGRDGSLGGGSATRTSGVQQHGRRPQRIIGDGEHLARHVAWHSPEPPHRVRPGFLAQEAPRQPAQGSGEHPEALADRAQVQRLPERVREDESQRANLALSPPG